MDITAAILKLTIMTNYSKNQALVTLILTQVMYLNQMVPLMETFVHKRTCCHKLYVKNGKN